MKLVFKRVLSTVLAVSVGVLSPSIPYSAALANEKDIQSKPGILFGFQSFLELLDDPDSRPPIRMSYSAENCTTFYCPAEPNEKGQLKVNESVGIPVAKGGLQEFENSVLWLTKKKGRDGLDGHVFYVAGVIKDDEKEVKAEHEAILAKYDLEDSIKIKVIPIPKQKLEGFSLKSAKIMGQWFTHWFYGPKRHYETPTSEEVAWGIGLTSLIEAPNIYYLATTMDSNVDASLTIGVHALILGAYSIYSKSLVNWLLTPNTHRAAQFLKQLFLSFPFILNYNIFGNYTAIMEFVAANPPSVSMAKFGTEIAQFVTSQPFTMLSQTLFYWAVITLTLGNWMNNVKGATRSADARVWKKIYEAPALALDAWILAVASGTAATVYFPIPLDILGFEGQSLEIFNNGHLGLLLLTGFGVMFYELTIDKSFEAYSWVRRKSTRWMDEFLRTQFGIDIPTPYRQLKATCLDVLNRVLPSKAAN